MRRKLSEEEKTVLLANYKVGTYLTRFLLGGWLIFVSLYYLAGVKEVINNFTSGKSLVGMGIIFGMVIGAIVFYGIPIYFLCSTGNQLKIIENNETYIGSAFYISSYHTNRGSGRRQYYVATVQLIDEYGNAYQTVECEAIENPQKYCKEGDRVEILYIGDRLLCLPRRML